MFWNNYKKCFYIILFIFCFSSCFNNKQKENINDDTTNNKAELSNEFQISLPRIEFSQNWNQLDFPMQHKIDENTYNILKLGTLDFIPAFDECEYVLDKVLIDSLELKMIALKILSSGEISEYLLTYANGNYIDNLLVSYEDNVEYFGLTGSVLEGNVVKVTTIDFESNDVLLEADTIITYYEISPTLQFVEIIEQI